LNRLEFMTSAVEAYRIHPPGTGGLRGGAREAHSHEGIRWPFVQFLLYNPYLFMGENGEIARDMERMLPVLVKCLLGFGLLDSEVQMLDVDMEADGKVQQRFCGHHGI